MFDEIKKEFQDDPEPWWVKAIFYPIFMILLGALLFL